MTRKLLLALFFTFTVSADPNVVRMGLVNAGAVSVTNGESTLVAWSNMAIPYRSNFRIYMRLIDSPFDRNGILVGRGYGARVATNGRQYLVGYSYEVSRFGSSVTYDNVLVQLVSPQGVKVGPPRAINRSLFGEMKALAWNGTHWLVAYSDGFANRVAFLHESLNVVHDVQLGTGRLVALEEIGGRWWSFENATFSLDAIEIRPDGTKGTQFSTTSFGAFVYVTEGPSPLLLTEEFSDGVSQRIVAQPFDPITGFGARRTFLAASRLLDVEAVEGGTLVLVASSDTRYDTIFVNAAGEASSQLPLFDAPRYGYYTLGSSKNGPLLFITKEPGDLYAYRIAPSRAPIDPASERLISQVSMVRARARSAAH